jgi:hypothetical protein
MQGFRDQPSANHYHQPVAARLGPPWYPPSAHLDVPTTSWPPVQILAQPPRSAPRPGPNPWTVNTAETPSPGNASALWVRATHGYGHDPGDRALAPSNPVVAVGQSADPRQPLHPMSWTPASTRLEPLDIRDTEGCLRRELAVARESLVGFQRQVSWLQRENCAVSSVLYQMLPDDYGSIRNALLGRELVEMTKIGRPLETSVGTPLILSYAGNNGPYKRLLFDECSPDALPPGLQPFHREKFSTTVNLEGCLCARFGPPVSAVLDGLRTLLDPREDKRVWPTISPIPSANLPPTAPRPPIPHARVVTGLHRRPLASGAPKANNSGKRQRSSTRKKKDLVVKVASSVPPTASANASAAEILPDYHDKSKTLCHSFKSHKGCAERPNCPHHHYRKRPCLHGAACQFHAGSKGAKGCTFDHIDHLGRPLFNLDQSDQEEGSPSSTKVYWIHNGTSAVESEADGDTQWRTLSKRL